MGVESPQFAALGFTAQSLSQFLNRSPDPIFAVRRGRVTFANAAFANALRAPSPSQLLGLSLVNDIVADDDREHIAALLREQNSRAVRLAQDVRCKRFDGTVFIMEYSAIRVGDHASPTSIVTCRDVTELRAQAIALRRAEEEFRLVFEGAPIGMTLQTLEGRFLRANRAMCMLTGFSEDELRQLTSTQLTHPDDRAQESAIGRDLISGSIVRSERRKRYLRKDGSVVEIALRTSLVRGDNGTPIGFVSHVLDITEQLRAAEALRVAEVQFRSIFENAPIGMAIYSFDGAASTIVRVNAALCRLLGYSEGELVGMPAQTIADDEHINADLDYARMNGLYPGQRIVVPRTYRAKDGRAVETERYLTITGDAKGIVVGAIVQIIDVTDRRAAERALNESEAMHRLLVHNLRNVALLLFDHDLRYTLVDGDHVMTGLGREARDLVGRTIRQLVDDPALVEYYEDLYRRALAGESTQWTIDRFGHNYDCHTGPVRDDVGNVIGGMTLLYEITEHRQLQSQLADSEARLSSLIENAADSMWSLDRDGKLTAFNSRFANEFRDSFGVDVSIGTSILDAVPVAARLRAKADLDATLAGEPVNAERAVVANGRERYMLLSQRPIISNGVITGASATAKDITGRRDMEIAEQRQREVVALLQSIATAANEASSSNAAIMRCLGLVAKFARWSVGHAFSIVGDELRSRPTWYLSESERFAAFVSFTDSLKARKGEGLAGEVLAAGKPVWKSSTRDVASFQRGAMAAECGLLTCFALPVFVGDEVVTVVEFFSERDEQPSDDMFAVMANVGVQLGRVIERERHGDLVRALSLTDELTALHNRRGFMVLANQQMRAIIRSRRPRCVMFADLDGLKRINDELGHEVGDRALVRFAGVLRDVFSEGDILSRFGGDEFVVFVDASIVDANVVVEKLRQRLLEHSAAHADEPALAASIGVVEINPDAMDTLDVVVSRADAEMYQNKRARRASHSNIVVPR